MKRARLVPPSDVPAVIGPLPPWPGRPVLLDGSAIYVRSTPATEAAVEPALYVHGLGGSSQNWTDLAGLLTHRLDAEAIDLPGFGRSEPLRRPSLARLADRVIRWIEYSGRGPVHLFGNSLGGAVSVRVAGTRPDLVRSLTLISPAMPFVDPRRSVQSGLVPLLVVPRADLLVRRAISVLGPERMAKVATELIYYDVSRVPPERLAEAVEELRRRMAVPWATSAYIRTLRGLVGGFFRAYLPGTGSLWRMASKITVPTLIVAGRNDRMVDIRVAVAAARAIPDSRLFILDNVGHVAQMEVPGTVARAVLGLLDELRDVAQ